MHRAMCVRGAGCVLVGSPLSARSADVTYLYILCDWKAVWELEGNRETRVRTGVPLSWQGPGAWRAAEKKPRFTFRCEVKLSSDFSITVLEAAVIEALVLLTSLDDGQGNTGVVPCAGIGDINIHMLQRSGVLVFSRRKELRSSCPVLAAIGLADRPDSPNLLIKQHIYT